MSGHWPPEWDDPDDNIPDEAGKPDGVAEAGLSEVAAYLASVPAPPMPGSVEARISAALAVEAASRAGITAPADGTVQAQRRAPADQTGGPRVLGPVPAPARARVPRRGPQGPRGGRGRRDRRKALGQFVLGPLVVCLLLAGIGFGLSRVGSASSSSSSATSVAGAPAAGTELVPASSAAASSAAGSSSAAPAGSSAAAAAPRAVSSAAAGSTVGLVVSATGTSYQQATLAQQARAQLLAAQARESVPSAAPTASSPSSAVPSASGAVRTYAPSSQLRACVLKVTGGVVPGLVDRATYRGTPAYVIASSSRVWVVGLGCTAAKPEVITTQALAG